MGYFEYSKDMLSQTSVALSETSAIGKIKIQLKKKTPELTRVVCVKVKSIRPQYSNLKEWMDDPQNVYIGRGGVVFIDNMRFPKEDSIWANPYKIGKDGTREEVIAKYRNHINDSIKKKKITKEQLCDLRGRTLGCWCKPDACHGDILVELIEGSFPD